MTCNHQFIKTADLTKMNENAVPIVQSTARTAYVQGAAVVCALCGQSRAIYEDGTVIKLKNGNGDPDGN